MSEIVARGKVWQALRDLPQHTIVRLITGSVVYICHHSDEAVCVADGVGEHWHELPGALGEVLKLPSDLCTAWIHAQEASEA